MCVAYEQQAGSMYVSAREFEYMVFFVNDTATHEIYTYGVVGSVRCV